jgi:hypothetical protein
MAGGWSFEFENVETRPSSHSPHVRCHMDEMNGEVINSAQTPTSRASRVR